MLVPPAERFPPHSWEVVETHPFPIGGYSTCPAIFEESGLSGPPHAIIQSSWTISILSAIRTWLERVDDTPQDRCLDFLRNRRAAFERHHRKHQTREQRRSEGGGRSCLTAQQPQYWHPRLGRAKCSRCRPMACCPPHVAVGEPAETCRSAKWPTILFGGIGV